MGSPVISFCLWECIHRRKTKNYAKNLGDIYKNIDVGKVFGFEKWNQIKNSHRI